MLELSQLPESGIVTVYDWMMAGDGKRYKHFFCTLWQIITDKMVPIDGFKSTEKWQLLGWRNSKIVAIFPGCKIQGLISCADIPNHTENHQGTDSKDTGVPVGVFNLDTGIGIF